MTPKSEYQELVLELPVPPLLPPKPEEKAERGVVVLDLTGDSEDIWVHVLP